MAKINRKTISILATAGGLVATAAIVGAHQNANHGAARPPIQQDKPIPTPPEPDTCGADMPARADTVFPAGTMHAALSSARVLQGGDGEMYMAVDLDARDAAKQNRPPLNVAIVIDRSGSMRGDKLAQAREAARRLVDRLDARDRASLVQFDDVAQTIVHSTLVDTSGREALLRGIDGITDGGETNIHDGMTLGRDEIVAGQSEGRLNRVILVSDGNATAGIVDIPSLARAAGTFSEQGVRISTIGLGLDYNEDLMEAIADNGRGRYYYVKNESELADVFTSELNSLQSTVATRAELRLTPACAGVEIAEVYGYESRREGSSVIVPLADLAGGEHRKVVARLRVPVEHIGKTGVVTATFRYDGASGTAGGTGVASVGVEITGDALAVDAAADTDVVAKVAQVETSSTMRKAADAYGRGDTAEAGRMIMEQQAKNSANQRRYNVPTAAMTPAAKPLEELDRNMAAPVGSAAAEHAKKQGKADAYMMSH